MTKDELREAVAKILYGLTRWERGSTEARDFYLSDPRALALLALFEEAYPLDTEKPKS